MEGAFLKVPAVAMSVASERKMNFEAAAVHCARILKKLMPVELGAVINVNIPRLSRGKPKGVRVVPQSSKGFDEYYIPQKDEQGQTVFQLAGEHHLADGVHADSTSLLEGYITVTALAPDMTDHKRTQELKNKQW
jgi:broad specificity polyphosphatase/5'/3'-nucleotidase SurE